MKISELLLEAKKYLKNNNIESYSIDSLIILSHITNLSKEQIIFGNHEVSTDNLIRFRKLLNRRINNEPVSHIINNREFFGLNFYVNKNVLDPRPDSETLVEVALELTQNHFTQDLVKILEIGCGSGCLSVALAKNINNSQIIGLDKSPKAVEISKKNSQNNNTENQCSFFCSDLFEKLEDDNFDLIISNPPYIKSAEISNLQNEVKNYEPIMALDGGDDGLCFYRDIALKSKKYLSDKGLIILEIGYDQKYSVIDIFQKQKFNLLESKKDLAGQDRVLAFSR